MTRHNNHNDPEPWVYLDEEGVPFRTRYAREDGVDEFGEEWSGWKFAPRSDSELRDAGYAIPEHCVEEPENLDPAPWMTIDEEGNAYRARHAHEDGVDADGHLWSGWTFAPRSYNELRKLGLV